MCGSKGWREYAKYVLMASSVHAQSPLTRVIPLPPHTHTHTQLAADPDAFVRWGKTEPSAATKAAQRCPADGAGCHAGDVCVNHFSPCFNDPRRINDPAHGCSVTVSASAYNFLRSGVSDWYLQNVLYRTLEEADGMWMDGAGWDNGGWPCSGSCPTSPGNFNASNTPLNQVEGREGEGRDGEGGRLE